MNRKVLFTRIGMAALAVMAATGHVAGNEPDGDAAALQAAPCGKKVLVTYFTWPEPDGVDASTGASRVIQSGRLYGNTEYVALLIARATGGELFAIRTDRQYPTPHKALIEEARREAEAGERPRLESAIQNLEEYDVVFVGYPNWWYDMPMAIYAFFEAYDFKDKTIVPFVTHGGSRFSQSVETIRRLEPRARVVEGPSVAARHVPDAEPTVRAWIENQSFLKE